jgi:hypothetical protein
MFDVVPVHPLLSRVCTEMLSAVICNSNLSPVVWSCQWNLCKYIWIAFEINMFCWVVVLIISRQTEAWNYAKACLHIHTNAPALISRHKNKPMYVYRNSLLGGIYSETKPMSHALQPRLSIPLIQLCTRDFLTQLCQISLTLNTTHKLVLLSIPLIQLPIF